MYTLENYSIKKKQHIYDVIRRKFLFLLYQKLMETT